jgi:acyl-CoA synthetase (AMP-forming)/AMP-acid ligase II
MEGAEPVDTIPKLLATLVAERGAQDAIATVDETLSYEQLERRTARLARGLLAIGAGKGSRIGLLAPSGTLWLTTLLASLRIGGLVTLVSTLCTPSELGHILRHSDIQFLIGARRFLRHDYADTLAAAFPELSAHPPGALRLPAAPYLRSIWLEDAAELRWARSIDDLLALADGPAAPDAQLLRAVEREVVPSDDAIIVYTSGSTAQPKAVIHTQWNATRFPRELAKVFRLKPGDRVMPHLPTFWLGGLGMTMQALSIGATLVYSVSPDPEEVLDAIQQLRVNRINSWGDVLVKLRQAAMARGMDVDQVVGLGPFRDARGEIIPLPLQSGMLGMSETFTAHSAEPIDQALPEDKAGAAGRQVGDYERRIVNPESGEEMPVGQVGELQLRGGALMSGLYKVDRRRVFTPDAFYQTGDLARLDADGYIYFVGRRGDMIKTKAANVSRLEVEAALQTLPEVRQCAVVGLPDAELGQRVVAAVVPTKGAVASEASIRGALRGILSSYKVPRQIVFVSEEDIPRTATGKLKLVELAALLSARLGETPVAPSAGGSL